jgi:CRISPR-associated endonuclease Cas3-HD
MSDSSKKNLHYANTKKQILSEHLQAVSQNASLIADQLNLSDHNIHNTIVNVAKISGLFHDVGKVLDFQDYIRDKIEKKQDYQSRLGESDEFAEETPLHNELSLLFLNLCPPSGIDRAGRLAVEFAVYWHHSKYSSKADRGKILMDYCEKKGEKLLSAFIQVANSIDATFPTIDSDQLMDGAYKIKFPDFYNPPKIYKNDDLSEVPWQINRDAVNHLSRYAVVTADRYVSKLDAKSINRPIERVRASRRTLTESIKKYAKLFPGERSERQLATAKIVAEYHKNIVLAGAGTGKTRVSLLCYDELGHDTGLIYVAPRVEVALSLLNELKKHLPEVKIQILTGQHKYTFCQNNKIECDMQDADIILTTIDQLAASISRVSELFTEYLQRYCVFDEYHEISKILSLNYIALVAMKIKEFKKNSSLYISATMDVPALRMVLDNAVVNRPARMASFNEKPVDIEFSKARNSGMKNALYIFNTAKAAQKTALEAFPVNQDILCYHSRYRPSDKLKLASRVLSEFGVEAIGSSSTLYAGPIAQASLNISRSTVATELGLPENIIQRIGRCNRFAEYERANIILYNDLVKHKKIKSGIKKITEGGGGYSSSHYSSSHYYERSSSEFFQQLAEGDIHCDQKITTTTDKLTDFYFKFCNTNRTFAEESVEFYRDSFNLLRKKNYYEPTRSFSSKKGTHWESFRGESFLIVAQIVTNGEQTGWTTETITDTENMISVETFLIQDFDLDLSGNLELALKHGQLQGWAEKVQELKRRARYMGFESVNKFLEYLAKCGVPAVFSVLGCTDQGYSYIKVTKDSHELLVGLMKN